MQENLLNQIKQHDRVAQKQLYHEYVKLVSHISMRYINNVHSAQDATQNTFVRVFQNIEMYDQTKGDIKSWIARIAVNEAIALLRSKNKVHFTQVDVSLDITTKAMDSNLFDKLELEDVTLVINKLDDENRVMLELFFSKEYTHKEIAELLDISVELSRVKLYRAKKSFYGKWDKMRNNEVERAI